MHKHQRWKSVQADERYAAPKMSTVKPPKFKVKSSEGECENIIKQQLDPPLPNAVWVCDFEYIKVGSKFYYLCAIMDLYFRKIISYKISKKIDTQLVLDTFKLALKSRDYPKGVLFHSDRGCQYTSKIFRKHLDCLNIIQSFSAKGHPYDNSVVESFFKFLKL